ncbi:MAG: methyltransferase domain-containing protein [Planctomycetota bacterium]
MKPASQLNLGCGQFPRDGWLNLDCDPNAKADVFHNLDEFPWPFADGEFETVFASHVLEHTSDPFAVMKEIHRILEPGGRAIIKVPHFSRGFTHPDHKRGFDVSFPMYFDPEFEGGFSGTMFELSRTRLKWFAQPWLKKKSLGPLSYAFGRVFGAGVDLFANLSPFAASRLWGYWIGGFEEVEFDLIKQKAAK